MATDPKTSAGPMVEATAATPADDDSHYTGVVIIHGLGNDKRSDNLLMIVNALAYWFNNKAKLVLRPAGPGRVWLETQLSESTDPEAVSSRATIELQAPAGAGGDPSGGPTLRLVFHEVWWAAAFGLQPVGTIIKWAQVQWSEQMRHILVPVGRLSGREAAQEMLQDRPSPSPSDASATSALPAARALRPLLRSALAVYGVIERMWKTVQWLVLSPIVALLLLLMSLARVLSSIGFVRNALLATFTTLSNTVMLHWVASTEVYMRDYVRAASIRQLFERELDDFLRDDQCDRVVILAYSMGTVIAYEALTTLPGRLGSQGSQKSITFICVAQALRRVWLLPGIDAQRLRGILPEGVRWLHFWARYDPVAAGPLTPQALPRPTAWTDEGASPPFDALRASLARCQNKVVVNTDSSFTDHTTYWDNLEQVVGPIASELVAGSSGLQQTVAAHLASPDDVLLRRWAVAWRNTLALAVGFAAGIGMLLLVITHARLLIDVQNFVTPLLGGLVNTLCPIKSCSLPPPPPPPSGLTIPDLSRYFELVYLVITYLTLKNLIGVVLVGVTFTIGLFAVGWIVPRPSPFGTPRLARADADAGGVQWVFLMSAVTLGLVFVTSLIFSTFVRTNGTQGAFITNVPATIYLVALALAQLVMLFAYLIGGIGVFSNQQWGWLGWSLLSLFLTYLFDPYYSSALLGIAVVSCLVVLFRLARATRTGLYWAVALQLVVILYAGVGSLAAELQLVGNSSFGTGVNVMPALPIFVYGLATLPAARGAASVRPGLASRVLFALAAAYLALFYSLALSRFGSNLVILPRQLFTSYPVSSHTTEPIGALTLGDARVWAAVAIALAALAVSLFDAVRTRQWIWLVVIPVVLAALGAVLVLLRVVVAVAPAVPDDALALSLAPLAAALVYCIWARPTKPDTGPAGDNASTQTPVPPPTPASAPLAPP